MWQAASPVILCQSFSISLRRAYFIYSLELSKYEYIQFDTTAASAYYVQNKKSKKEAR